MNVLLVYPRYPNTFWSFKHALPFISKKAAFPPLGLLSVASMLPDEWQKKLVDMNTDHLSDKDIKWADYVFISGMVVQRNSAKNVIKKCNLLKTPVVAGGPLFTEEPDDFDGVDHFVLNEGEVTLPMFLEDLKNGFAKPMYVSQERPDISHTPMPTWDLIDMNKYSSMSMQYSRGCPFDCEFCDIVVLNGRIPRTKTREQVLAELDALYVRGWRDNVFIVDDNFIGNKRKLKNEIVPAISRWMIEHRFPFSLFTEASINLADDAELMEMMAQANFNTVFIGIESPNEESLIECGKSHNRNRDLVAAVKTIQNHGFQVHGGFILGFDNDPKSIFDNQIDFIQKSGIVTAMVGLLNAPVGTKLYKRLKKENRLIETFSGDNTDLSMNFVPKMEKQELLSGYKKVLNTIYNYTNYYDRIMMFIKEYKPKGKTKVTLSTFKWSNLRAFFKTAWHVGLKPKEGKRRFWDLMGWTIIKHPGTLFLAVMLSIYGFHFRKVVENYTHLL
ncbi:B12-binding domain-containing radical SAM protein [Chloroflexota bacterium]